MDGNNLVNDIQLQGNSYQAAKPSTSYQSFLQLNPEHIVPDLYHGIQHQSVLPAASVKDEQTNSSSNVQVYTRNPPTYVEYQSQQNLMNDGSADGQYTQHTLVNNSEQNVINSAPHVLFQSNDSLSQSNRPADSAGIIEPSPSALIEEFNDKLIWCEDCGTSKQADCLEHPPIVMSDKKVLSLARQTLPRHFSITYTANRSDSVVCSKRIKKCSRFGPLLGSKISPDQLDKGQLDNYTFRIFRSQAEFDCLDISDEDVSNWMMFIRPAQSVFEQNLVAYQHNGNIYFSSIRNINAGEELKVGYSESYALLMGVKALKHSVNPVPPPEKKVLVKEGFPCDTCDVVFADFESLDAHNCPNEVVRTDQSAKGGRTRNKRKGKPQKLGSVPKTKITAGDKKLANHKVSNTKKYTRNAIEAVKCQECDVSFSNRRRLAIHMYVHTGEYPYKCNQPNCHKTFNTKFKLDRHLLTHGSRDFMCVHCGKAFARKDNLNAHLVIHDSSRQVYKCTFSQCEKKYNSKLSYNVHVALHKVEEEGSLECSLCHKLFDSTVTVTQHIRVHGGSYKSKGIMEKKFECTNCEKRFFASKDRDRHLLTHTKERNFECNFCEMKFSRADHLKRHCLKIHPDGKQKVKSGRGRATNAEHLAEMSAAEFTRSIQHLLAETNMMENTSVTVPLSSGPDLTNTTMHITPLINTRTGNQSDSLSFAPVPGQRSNITTFLHNLSHSNANTNAASKQSVAWQQGQGETNSGRYVIAGDPMNQQPDRYYITADSVRLPLPNDSTVAATYLVPQDGCHQPSTTINLDSLNRQSSLMMESSQALPSDSLSNDYTSDGLKVLTGLTPIFLNADTTSTDGTDLLPIVYQTNQH